MAALTLLTGEIRWELKTCSPLNDRMRLFGYGNMVVAIKPLNYSRKIGRVVYSSGLENRRAFTALRQFESGIFRMPTMKETFGTTRDYMGH